MQGIRKRIFVITITLLMFGVVMIYSASGIYAYEQFGDSAFFLKRHLIFLAAGVVAMFFVMSLGMSSIERSSKVLMILSLGLLLCVLVPGLGAEAGGARRWFRFFQFSLQPSELAKFALVVYLASFMERKGYKIKDFATGYVPAAFMVALTAGLVLLQPDLGTSVAIFLIGFLIIFMGGGRLKHIILTVLAGLPFLYYLIFSVPYRRRRILIFLNPWRDKEGAGFQIVQSFLAFGSGGIFGVGLGQSRQKLFYLPESHTDFIFSIIGEELGFIGAASVVTLFALFVWQGMRAFLKEERPFNKFLIFGITSMIALEAIINMGVSVGAFPTKGLPLPFISYGGSSLVFHMAAIGVMLNAMRE